MNRRFGRVVVVTVAGLACAVPLASCGSTQTSAGGNTYRVGVPLPETGPAAQDGKLAWEAMQIAANHINATGGVLGHRIVLVEQDDASDPQISVNAANKLVSLGVQATIGSYSSSAALPAEPIYARAGIPNIQPASNSTALTQKGLRNIFLVNPGGVVQAATAAKFIVNVMHERKVALVDDQSAYGADLATATARDLKSLGAAVTTSQHVAAATQDFSSVVTAVRASGAQAIYWTGYFSQGGLFIKQVRNSALKVLFVTGDGSVDPAFISTAGKAADGTYGMGSLTGQFIRGRAIAEFNAAFAARFHTAPGAYQVYYYDAVEVLAKAAEEARSLEPSRVIRALHSLKVAGLTGAISFAENGRRQGGTFVVLRVMNGNYALAPEQPR